MKRGYIIITVLLLFLAVNVEIVSGKSFDDISGYEWYADNVIDLTDNDIINGYPDGNFYPNKSIGCDEFIKTIALIKGYDINNGENYWGFHYIEKALELGLITETEYDKSPDAHIYKKPITRYEMIRIAVRACDEDLMEYEPYNSDNIDDWDTIPDEYKPYVAKGYSIGLVKGYPDGSFKGENLLSRAEASVIIWRFYDYMSKNSLNFKPVDETLKAKLLDGSNIDIIRNYSDFGTFVDYKDSNLVIKDNNNWVSFSEIGIKQDEKNLCENMMLAWIDEITNNIQSGYLYTGYGSQAFSLVYENNQGFAPIIFRFYNNGEINILISELTKQDAVDWDDFDSNYLQLLQRTCDFIYPENSQLLYETIINEYKNQIGEREYSNIININEATIHIQQEDMYLRYSIR